MQKIPALLKGGGDGEESAPSSTFQPWLHTDGDGETTKECVWKLRASCRDTLPDVESLWAHTHTHNHTYPNGHQDGYLVEPLDITST